MAAVVPDQARAGSPADAGARLVSAWLGLAVSALGASALFALLLVASRAPVLGPLLPAHDFFRPALVLHVNLSSVVWFLAFAGAAWTISGGRRAPALSWAGLTLAAGGSLALAVSPFGGVPPALTNNYVPVLDSGTFLWGLAVFAAGVCLAALRLAGAGWRGEPTVAMPAGFRAAAWASTAAAAVAAVSFGWSWAGVPSFLSSAARFESLFWGPGHVLQAANTLLMAGCWLWLAELSGLRAPLGRRGIAVAVALGLLPLLAVPAIHAAHGPVTAEFRAAFTEFMRWGIWPVAAWTGGAVLIALARGPRGAESAPGARAALLLSLVLFTAGAAIGAFIRADNAMVPAHYHGTIGAVTLAFMGTVAALLPRLGFAAPPAGLARWQALAYGGGTLAMALGLAWSGQMGVGRKLSGDLQSLDSAGEVAGMALMAAGGAVAVLGTLLFVLLAWRCATGRRGADAAARMAPAPGGTALRRADRRPLAVVLTVSLVLALGTLVSVVPSKGPREAAPPAAVPEPQMDRRLHHAREAEVKQRFEQAVLMLHAKDYDHAVTALHRVLQIAPRMPEAHVNMGYALIGLKEYRAAKDFFEGAIALRPMQANAYYGLAVALEELGDLEGALGAMRTFTHLAKSDDPFRRKAESAIWEWESRPRNPPSSATGEKGAGR